MLISIRIAENYEFNNSLKYQILKQHNVSVKNPFIMLKVNLKILYNTPKRRTIKVHTGNN